MLKLKDRKIFKVLRSKKSFIWANETIRTHDEHDTLPDTRHVIL